MTIESRIPESEERKGNFTGLILGSYQAEAYTRHVMQTLEENGVRALHPVGQLETQCRIEPLILSSSFDYDRDGPLMDREFVEMLDEADFVYYVVVEGWAGVCYGPQLGAFWSPKKPVYVSSKLIGDIFYDTTDKLPKVKPVDQLLAMLKTGELELDTYPFNLK